ncbi:MULTISPECIES: ABC transporter permease [Streptomyces]|uniref:ABC transporter permease n=1 Tax=Streptomyces TaxID=1883 RepID=UPI0011A2C112|nr:ABC transporter permease [Streptomyces sp. CFMR 7]
MSLPRVFTAGVRRGRIEIGQAFGRPRELFSFLSTPALFVVLALFVDRDIPGSSVPMADLMVAGGVSTMVIQTALLTLPQVLATDREDGTLLRLKAVPGGIPAYLVAKTLVVAATALLGAALTLAAGALVVGSGLPVDAAHWLTLAWVLLLGLVGLAPLGAAIGVLLPNARQALGLAMLPILFLMIASGLYFPVTVMPELLQNIVQVFPMKWIAQGTRSALLPDAALSAETQGSWQHLRTLGVVGLWALVGYLLVPGLIRRTTRRQSGSRPRRSELV